MMTRFAALGAAAALLAGTAGAQTSTAPAATAAPAKPKKICRKEVEVGSIMPMRTCHTKEEWDAIDLRNGDAVKQSNDPRGRYGGYLQSRGG